MSRLIVNAPAYSLWQGDAVEFLRALPADSVDLIVTDPPYESLEKHRAIGTTTRLKQSDGSSNEWFDIFPNARFRELFVQLYRVLKKGSHLYLFCDSDTYRSLFVPKVEPEKIQELYALAEYANQLEQSVQNLSTWTIGEEAGFKLWKPIVWDKQAIGMGYHYRARYEFVLFYEKGKRNLNDRSTPDVLDDVIDVKRVAGKEAYPTEKPVPLLEVFVKQSSEPGQLVCDPFMGSGSQGEAALKHGRRFVGNDLSPKSLDTATKRLAPWLEDEGEPPL